jgi:nucleotide-binding universal stress UspA family protein
MITLKRILVPHDFSETSAGAMKYATSLARLFGAKIDVLHVSEKARTEMATEFPLGLEASSVAAFRERFLKIVTPREMTELHPELQLRPGSPDIEITRYAKEQEVDLIVMGTHGRGFVAHAVMGSVAEKVVRTASCPVLTVRTPQDEFAVPNIVVATDFGAASDTALEYGRTLGRTFGARLHVLHVMENYFLRAVVADPHALEARAREHLSDRLTDHDRQALQAIGVLEMSETPADAIVEYANKTNIDLIVMGTHGRRSMERLLMGSVAERVVRTASCPVLTVRHPEHEFVVPDAPAVVDGPRAQ